MRLTEDVALLVQYHCTVVSSMATSSTCDSWVGREEGTQKVMELGVVGSLFSLHETVDTRPIRNWRRITNQ